MCTTEAVTAMPRYLLRWVLSAGTDSGADAAVTAHLQGMSVALEPNPTMILADASVGEPARLWRSSSP